MKKIETVPPLPAQDELHLWLAILEAECRKKKNELAKSPPGRVELSKSHGCTQAYFMNGRSRRYLSAKDAQLLAAMAQKRYLQYEIESLEETISLVHQLFDNQEKRSVISAHLRLPEKLRVHVEPATLTDEEYAKRWQAVSWSQKPVSENLPYYTVRGEHVRSKSEIIIANALLQAGVPYRYEYPLLLKGALIHPDFMCLNVRTRREYYWEHLGMMDDAEYHNDAIIRLERYAQADIFPFDNLLLTAEWKDRQLDSRRVVHLIKRYLI